ncbi:hypothetical protein ABVK25_011895, partial [Lepraria finkii]
EHLVSISPLFIFTPGRSFTPTTRPGSFSTIMLGKTTTTHLRSHPTSPSSRFYKF